MKRLILAVLLSLVSAPAFAAWARVGTFLVGNSTSAATTLVVATSAALEAGNIGVCVVAKDETGAGTTDGDNLQVIGVTDASSNTWQRAVEFCNMQTSTAANGACVDIWFVQPSVTIASAANVTFTFLASTTSRAATCDEFTNTGVVGRAAGFAGIANDAADPGSMTDATGIAREHLFIRASACETNVTTYTADADYVAFGGSTTTSTANTGTAATSMGARGESRIANEATSAASDPTYAAVDCASAMAALDINPPFGWWGIQW